MTSIYLVRRGELWLRFTAHSECFSSLDLANVFGTFHDAELSARRHGGEPVEFREVGGDTADGALAAAEATIARLREELEQLRNRPSTHELAKRFLEPTE